MTLYQLRPYQDARKGPERKLSLWRRFVLWINQPPKAEVFKFSNPTKWKLDRVRRKARGAL